MYIKTAHVFVRFTDLIMPRGDKFFPGDLVFAKVKGYPPWPARITGMASKDRQAILLD